MSEEEGGSLHRTRIAGTIVRRFSVLVLSVMLVSSSVDAFGLVVFSTRTAATAMTRIATLTSTTSKSTSTTTGRTKQPRKRTMSLCSSPNDEEDEDDGWGITPSVGDTSTSTTKNNGGRSTLETDRKLNELRSLREEASNKATVPSSSSLDSREAPAERDLFIPIMAIVSLAGLLGAYGYETLRLASRGELYLPF
jgi:hypothetical protein